MVRGFSFCRAADTTTVQQRRSSWCQLGEVPAGFFVMTACAGVGGYCSVTGGCRLWRRITKFAPLFVLSGLAKPLECQGGGVLSVEEYVGS